MDLRQMTGTRRFPTLNAYRYSTCTYLDFSAAGDTHKSTTLARLNAWLILSIQLSPGRKSFGATQVLIPLPLRQPSKGEIRLQSLAQKLTKTTPRLPRLRCLKTIFFPERCIPVVRQSNCLTMPGTCVGYEDGPTVLRTKHVGQWSENRCPRRAVARHLLPNCFQMQLTESDADAASGNIAPKRKRF